MHETRTSPAAGNGGSLFTGIVAALILALCAMLVGATTLHWGGMLWNVAGWLFPASVALWVLIFISAARNLRRGVITGGWCEAFVLLWLAYALFSYLYAPAEYVARREWLWILTYAGVFVALRNFVYSQQKYYWLLAMVLLCATAVCVFALLHRQPVYDIWGLPRPNYGLRASGTFGCPNHFGNFMVMAGLVAGGFGFYNRLRWPVRLLCFYLLFMFTVGVYYSVSRGSMLAWVAGLGAALLFLLLDKRLSLKLKLILLGIVLCGAGFAVAMVAGNFFIMSRVEQTLGGDIRLLLAQDALRIWEGHKWFGSGMATFDFWHMRVHQAGFFGRAEYTHNDYLNLLADYGAVGAAMVFGFFAALVARLWSRTSLEGEPADRQIAVRIAWCVLTAMAVHAVVDFNFHIPACALTFFIVMAAGSAQVSRRPVGGNRFVHAGSIALMVAAPVAIFFLVTLTSRTWQSTRLLDRPEAELTAMTPAAVATEVARIMSIDPANAAALEKAGDILRFQAAALSRRLRTVEDEATARQLLVEREELGQQALRYYELAQRANLLSDNPLLKQALTLDTLERYDEAYLYYAKALKNQPYNFYFRGYYGFHLLATGQDQLARAEFENALRVPPESGDANQDLREMVKEALALLPKQ